jgi:hypothetical protein
MQISRPTVNVVATLVLFAFANASANPKAIDPPLRAAGPVKAHVAKSLPKPHDKLGSQTDVPNTYFGVSGSGGSLLAGLLLGPLGVLVNQANTHAGNAKVASDTASLEALNLAQLLREAEPTLEVTDTRSPDAFMLTPSARLFAHKNNPLLLACVLKAEYEEPGSKPWKLYYQVNMEGSFAQNDPSLNAALHTALKACLVEAKQLFVDHVRGDLGPAETAKIKLADFTLSMPTYRSLLPQRVVGNDGVSVQRFRRADVLRVE